jgi:hypothetical protein
MSTGSIENAVQEAIAVLRATRWPIAEAEGNVPAVPGLYAVYGSEQAWVDLGLSEDDIAGAPLYVGKAEDSFVSRDLRTHFSSGRTGQSTVRRSFAALLASSLGLRGIPRNTQVPGHFANYGLSPVDDEALTSWMWRHLALAVWPATKGLALVDVEREVVRLLDPPINIEHLPRSSRKDLSAARKALADEARQWAKDRQAAQ